MTTNTQFYITMLANNICEAVVAVDGKTHTINCTLKESVLNDRLRELVSAGQLHTKVVPKTANPDAVYAWDLVKNSWVLIRFKEVKSFKLLTGSLADLQAAKSRPAISVYAQLQDTTPAAIAPEVLASYKVPTTEDRRNFYVQALRGGPCVIEFTKQNGDVRVMNATLEPSKLDELGLTPTTTKEKHPNDNLDTIKVVDLDAKGWRAFNVSRVISFKTGTNGLVKRRTTLTPDV